jgi:hypothetical protein
VRCRRQFSSTRPRSSLNSPWRAPRSSVSPGGGARSGRWLSSAWRRGRRLAPYWGDGSSCGGGGRFDPISSTVGGHESCRSDRPRVASGPVHSPARRRGMGAVRPKGWCLRTAGIGQDPGPAPPALLTAPGAALVTLIGQTPPGRFSQGSRRWRWLRCLLSSEGGCCPGGVGGCDGHGSRDRGIAPVAARQSLMSATRAARRMPVQPCGVVSNGSRAEPVMDHDLESA